MIESPFNIPKIKPINEHPRLLLTKKDLPRIRENLLRKENKLAFEAFNKLCECEITGKGLEPEHGTYNYKETLAIEALAFKALLSGNKEDARKAIDTALFLLYNLKLSGTIMEARWSGHMMFVCSEVYDWCYQYLTEEEKFKIWDRCEDLAIYYFEMKFPPREQSPISGHGAEAQLLRDAIAFSIAVYDERPDFYNFCAGRILDEYVPADKMLFEGGAHGQGPTYGTYRFTCTMWCELIFKAMTGKGIFVNLENVANWIYYVTRPDGQELRLGDDTIEFKAFSEDKKTPFITPMFFSYVLWGRKEYYDYYINNLTKECFDINHTSIYREGLMSPVSILIFDRLCGDELKSVPYAKCKYFGFPIGQTIFKDKDTLIFMKIGEYWIANHDHLDTGCFQVYKGAPLFTDSGVYGRDYHGAHRKQYLIKTIAHNCLTIERTDRNQFGEWPKDHQYDGGTKYPCGGQEPANTDILFSEDYHMANVISHFESDDGCELVGDLSPAYIHSCSKVIRSFNYNHKEHKLIIKDEIDSLEAEYKKTFHLHIQTEPIIDGNRIIVENSGHRAVCTVVSPSNAIITKVGGKGHECEVEGINFGSSDVNENVEYGWGEVKISPLDKNIHDVFEIEISMN